MDQWSTFVWSGAFNKIIFSFASYIPLIVIVYLLVINTFFIDKIDDKF